jgi:hypothetical protein
MPRLFITLCFGLFSAAVFSEPQLPAELHGYWVPSSASCSSTLGIRVSANAIQFKNKTMIQAFPVEACFSCEGGVRYSGIVVWGIPVGANEQPFVSYFNARERKGVATLEINSTGLQSKFPLNDVELKRCGA